MELTKEKVLNDIEGLKRKIASIEIMDPYEFALLLVENRFGKYDCIYPFTNEKLYVFLKYMDVSKRLLTVTASGDQTLFAILNGATKIDSFDVNRMAKYFAELKIAAIKALDYREFKKFYKVKKLLPTNIKNNPNFLMDINVNYFNRILLKLSEEYAFFFEMFYDLIKKSNVNVDTLINFNFIPFYSGYLQKDKFYELKDRLQNVEKIDYYDCDIFDLKNYIGNKKYSSILFSNITSYFEEEALNNLLNLLSDIQDNLESDALVQFGYGSSDLGLQRIGKNRVTKEFVDLHNDVLFDVEEEDKIITFYKAKKS